MILSRFFNIIIIGDSMEYELYDKDKVIGKVKIYNRNKKSHTIIDSKKNTKYKLPPKINNQTYLVRVCVNTEDDLYDVVKLYVSKDIYSEIDNIKKFNKISRIKKNSKIDIILPYNSLSKLDLSKEDIDVSSVLNSKVNFIKNCYINNRELDLKDKLNNIIVGFNAFKASNEYDFLTDEEKNKKIKTFILDANKLINYIESVTDYRYCVDFITPIRVIK